MVMSLSPRDEIVILTDFASAIVYLDHSLGCLLLLAIGQQVDKERTGFVPPTETERLHYERCERRDGFVSVRPYLCLYVDALLTLAMQRSRLWCRCGNWSFLLGVHASGPDMDPSELVPPSKSE